MSSLGFGVWGLGFGVWGRVDAYFAVGRQVWGLGFWVLGFGFGVECWAFRTLSPHPYGVRPNNPALSVTSRPLLAAKHHLEGDSGVPFTERVNRRLSVDVGRRFVDRVRHPVVKSEESGEWERPAGDGGSVEGCGRGAGCRQMERYCGSALGTGVE